MRTFIHSNDRGFTLIEALVALVVLSIGMLGIAALYVESLKAGRTAIYRTQAVALAADMADRIRVNPVPLPADDPDAPAIQAAYLGSGANQGCVGGGVDCTQAEMADHDVFLWNQVLQGLLPNGQGEIEVNDAVLPAEYTIRVTWSEVGEPDAVAYELVTQI